jgi:hypothetical protein
MAGKGQTKLRVIDALDHPHGGRILRLRLMEGDAPRVRDLRGTTLRATGPRGQERTARVLGFAAFGGRPSDDRLRETGRVDVHVEEEGEGDPVGLTWVVTPS